MKRPDRQEKDFFLLAKQIKNQQKLNSNKYENDLEERLARQSQEALKMINAYRKFQNVKSTNRPQSKNVNKNTQQPIHQPKSTYANKIKQTLRQLNANRAKQYEKLSQKHLELKSQKNINSLQLNNQKQYKQKQKSQTQKKLISKAVQKFFNIFNGILIKKKKLMIKSLKEYSDQLLQNDYKMARRYRLFRVFSLWKQETALLKIQNQKRIKENQMKQLQGLQMAKQFYIFITEKKVLKYWSKVAKAQKKKRKYQQELKKIQIQRNLINSQKETNQTQIQNNQQSSQGNSHLQNKLRGFLSGLKQKIQHKQTDKKQLNPIKQKTEQQNSQSQAFHSQRNHNESLNENQQQNQQQIQNQPNQNQNQNSPSNNQQPSIPQKPLTNQQLQKKRKQIHQRSKNRKQALQKIKKQKQLQKKKQDQQRKQLQKKIEQQQKRIKELKYKEFQQRKKLERQWEEREKVLAKRADQWNKLRLVRFYGFEKWKQLKQATKQNTLNLTKIVEKIMIRHLGSQLIENLNENMQSVLNQLNSKMQRIYNRNLKKKTLSGFKIQQAQMNEQKISLQSFHQVHTQKIFFSLWKQTLDQLRLQNIEQQRPLIKKANQFSKINLMLKSLKQLQEHAKQSKKQKNINQQKQKIKSKIKNIISEKINIDYEEFL